MVSSLPGGIDDTASRRDPYWSTKTNEQLLDDAARIQAEIQRRTEEAKKPKFPMTWDGLRLYCTKDDRGTDADELGLEGACARNFCYAGLELTFRVVIHENGDTIATHIKYPKTDKFLALPAHMKLN